MAEDKYSRGARFNWLFVIAAVLCLAVTAAFIYYYSQVGNILAEKDAEIASLRGQIVSIDSRFNSLQGDLSAANSTITKLQKDFAVSQTEVADANAYIDTVQGQVANLTAQVNTLKAEKQQFQNITGMLESKVITEQTTIHQGMGQVTSMVSFKADYAGYVVVTATVSSTTGFIQVTCDNPAYPFNTNKYYTADQMVFSIPVLPGGIGIFAGNTDKLYEPNATVAVTYYY